MTKRYKAEPISRTYLLTTTVGVLLATFTLVCRVCTPVADWYATRVYPLLSAVLSWLASGTAYNLEEPAIGLLIAAFLAIIVAGIRRRWGFGRCLRYELTLVLWAYVWFYVGWCVNYSRSSLYARASVEPSQFDGPTFRSFLSDYTVRLNASWTADTITDRLVLEGDVKTFYAHVPAQYGLATPRPWQHPKRILLNRLYSRSGILGFMAPLFAESCLNADLLAFELPSVYAHEYAHLMGVSSEAEASWWAYQVCTASCIPAVRYSGYLSVLPYVARDAFAILSEEEYVAWLQSLRPEILADAEAEGEHWRTLRSVAVREMHEQVYDAFLKGNNVEAGRQDYSRVTRLLIDLKYYAMMKDILQFLQDLAANNDRDWFNANRERYQKAQATWSELCLQLIHEIGQYAPDIARLTLRDCTYRIYRDTRFSADKSPYKTHFGVFLAPGGKRSMHSGYYFHVGTGTGEGYPHAHMLAVGNYCYDPKAVKVLREDICYGWEEFSRDVLGAADPRFHPDMDGALKKVPRDFDPALPCADWLRMKSYGLSFNVGNDFLLAPDLAPRVAEIFRTAKPFNDFINRGVDFAAHEM